MVVKESSITYQIHPTAPGVWFKRQHEFKPHGPYVCSDETARVDKDTGRMLPALCSTNHNEYKAKSAQNRKDKVNLLTNTTPSGKGGIEAAAEEETKGASTEPADDDVDDDIESAY